MFVQGCMLGGSRLLDFANFDGLGLLGFWAEGIALNLPVKHKVIWSGHENGLESLVMIP